ncbi:MAG: 50S ribosomal protein L9 [Pseudomonadota bacterium]|nr:50S ribosomal protein L9 [Pseudomonadota bacterium]MED5312403.1 50S ribosomal protein L9 [Pseudomonadota bacterium]
MEIILLERVEKLGQMGDVVKVKPGYARNFLLPQGKALRANKANLERFETEKSQREADNLARRSDAETEAGKMDGLAVSMVRAASEMGQLFGSVTSRDISEAVTEAGFTITRSQVIMEKSIKTLGLHETRIRLHPEVTVTVTVNVARSLDEAETQLRTGVAVTGMIDDEVEVAEVVVAEETATDEAPAEDAAADETPAAETAPEDAAADEAPAEEASGDSDEA